MIRFPVTDNSTVHIGISNSIRGEKIAKRIRSTGDIPYNEATKNYIRSLSRRKGYHLVIRKDSIGQTEVTSILFDTEKDYSFFLLRWV